MRLIPGLIAILVIAFPSIQLQAARIRVSQESRPGAGDFDQNVLGSIESADAGGVSAAEFYSYSEEYYFSFRGNGPPNLTTSQWDVSTDGFWPHVPYPCAFAAGGLTPMAGHRRPSVNATGLTTKVVSFSYAPKVSLHA